MAGSDTTITNPPEQRGYQRGSDPITAMRIYGTGSEMPMLPTEATYTFGRGEVCELRLVGAMENKLVARLQARIDRVRTSTSSNKSLHVTDISAGRNDMVIDGVASKAFEMGAGDSFYIGKTRYFAMTDEMRSARAVFADILGLDKHKAIDDALIAAVQEPTSHMLLIGELGCDQIRMGEVIHYASHRRHRRFHQITEATLDRQTLLDTAYGTLLVPLFQKGKLDQQLVAAAVDPQMDLRLLICSLSPGKVAASFPPEVLQRPYEIHIPPLRERQGEIPLLLDKWFVARRSPLRFAELRPELQASLLAHQWLQNLQELRETADRLAALAHYDTRYKYTKDDERLDSQLRRWEIKMKVKLAFPLSPKETKS